MAHGFITLEDKTSLLYHHTAFHHPASERGVRFNDPKIDLKIPISIEVISDRDQSYPFLAQDFSGIKI
jgi:dTDP-4-dehydrorhamnose 3,5-epimerase